MARRAVADYDRAVTRHLAAEVRSVDQAGVERWATHPLATYRLQGMVVNWGIPSLSVLVRQSNTRLGRLPADEEIAMVAFPVEETRHLSDLLNLSARRSPGRWPRWEQRNGRVYLQLPSTDGRSIAKGIDRAKVVVRNRRAPSPRATETWNDSSTR